MRIIVVLASLLLVGGLVLWVLANRSRPQPADTPPAVAADRTPARSAARNRQPSRDPAVRLAQIKTCAGEHDPETVAFLADLATTDDNAILRAEAVTVLGKVPALAPTAAKAGETIKTAIKDRDPTVVARAAEAYAGLRPQGAMANLLTAYEINRNRPDGYGEIIRRACIKALAAIRDPACAGFLAKELDGDEDLSYDNELVRTLGILGNREAVASVRRHLDRLLAHRPTEDIAKFPWQEAVDLARTALKQLGAEVP